MFTILVVLVLFVGVPILIGYMIYFGSRYDEWRIEVKRGRRRQAASPPAIHRA